MDDILQKDHKYNSCENCVNAKKPVYCCLTDCENISRLKEAEEAKKYELFD